MKSPYPCRSRPAAGPVIACASRRPPYAREHRVLRPGHHAFREPPTSAHPHHPRGTSAWTPAPRGHRGPLRRLPPLLRRGHPPLPRGRHVPPELLRLPLLRRRGRRRARRAPRRPTSRPRSGSLQPTPTSALPPKPNAPAPAPRSRPTPTSRPKKRAIFKALREQQ